MKRSLSAKNPTPQQVEKIRLLLSTYQDGTGQQATKNGTLPNWRDFERAVSIAMNGDGTENKSLFDVVVRPRGAHAHGISCKMRSELRSAYTKGVVYLEVSNAAGEFWDVLREIGINTTTEMSARAGEAGEAIVGLVEQWAEDAKASESVSLDESYYLVLLWSSRSIEYQLFQLALDLPDPSDLDWCVRKSKTKEGSGCLVGSHEGRVLIEWYGNSGGQLKYYPKVSEALWKSELFSLEPLPFTENGYGIAQKARTFFPEKWAETDK